MAKRPTFSALQPRQEKPPRRRTLSQGRQTKSAPYPRRPPAAPAERERLQKILSSAGIASRRKAEELIRTGHVRINGTVVTQLGTQADPRRDRITVDGRQLPPRDEPSYILLHKPVNVVTTLADPEGRPTVRALLPRPRLRLFPVGRLDYHSSGLLLMTNDGELALRLTHPRYGVRKTYHVKVKGTPAAQTLARLESGVRLPDGRTGAAQVRVLRSEAGKSWLEITVSEGRKRQVRRMCEHLGHPVEKLRRIALGPLQLGKLPPGAHRALTEREVSALRRAVGLG